MKGMKVGQGKIPSADLDAPDAPTVAEVAEVEEVDVNCSECTRGEETDAAKEASSIVRALDTRFVMPHLFPGADMEEVRPPSPSHSPGGASNPGTPMGGTPIWGTPGTPDASVPVALRESTCVYAPGTCAGSCWSRCTSGAARSPE